MTDNERKAFNDGVASVWKAIGKVTPRKGDYNLLFNAVHGTEKYPNGFNVEIYTFHESEVEV
jgi:hypothetical protein